jgi:hypothetical protein
MKEMIKTNVNEELKLGKKMSNWLSTNQFNEKDEYYTPKRLVEAILPFIKPNSTIWCPFDTKDSEFVILLKECNHTVIYSHIWLGQDFFEYEPDVKYDYIISNPPFTKKLEVLERLYKLNKPFAMILGLPILNYQEIGNFFLDKDLQLLIVDKKVSFDGNTASFNNSYFCYKMLPKDIMFTHLENNNSKKYFTPSRMYKNNNREEK